MIYQEEDIVTDVVARKKLIDSWKYPSNMSRKAEAYKRKSCYNDKTKLFVVEELLKQFDTSTVNEMWYALSNISIYKKVVNKLARVYSEGVQRKGPTDEVTKSIDSLAKIMDINNRMKKINRWQKSSKSVIAGPIPVQLPDGTYQIKVDVQQAYNYDVVEDPNDKEKAMFIVISDYKPQATTTQTPVDPASAGRLPGVPMEPQQLQNVDPGVKQTATLVDSYTQQQQKPEDKLTTQDDEEYIWWSAKYHFTTDGKGVIKNMVEDTGQQTEQDLSNPLMEIPWDNYSIDQDGCFYGEGGDDLVDGAILINSMITNSQHIGVTQGYGQFWVKGKNLQKVYKTGPNKAITFEMEDKDTPDPSIGYASANPPLDALKNQVVMYVALYLTTNNLSTRAVATELNGTDMASGVAMMIDKSESTEDVNDQQSIFLNKEPNLWRKIQKWDTIYRAKNLLSEDFKMIPPLPVGIDKTIQIKFEEASPIQTEGDKIDALQKRKDLGINTMVELMIKDDPTLTEEKAKEKLLEIQKEAVQRAQTAMIGAPNESNKQPGFGQPNDNNPGSGNKPPAQKDPGSSDGGSGGSAGGKGAEQP